MARGRAGLGALPEAQGLAACARQVHGHGREVAPDDVLALLAPHDAGTEPEDDFVEDTVDRLLALLGLPLPEGVPSDG